MKITKGLLRNKGAICGGLDYFDSLFPEGWEGEWTPMHQALLLGDKEARKHWGWLVAVGVIPEHSMAGWKLAGTDLSEADLRWADLRWADLSDADLSWADLGGADLGGADLSGANLEGADLYGAVLGDWGRDPTGYARKKDAS